VQTELTKEMFDSMRKGKQMVVAAMNIQQKTMGFPVPLTGFAKAYDGAPVDNAKYEESRRQLMEVFRKRQQELAAKAAEAEQKKEAQQTTPTQGQAAAPANASAAPKKIAPAAPVEERQARTTLQPFTKGRAGSSARPHRLWKEGGLERERARWRCSMLLQEAEAENAVAQVFE
jgi:hypothetical protein